MLIKIHKKTIVWKPVVFEVLQFEDLLNKGILDITTEIDLLNKGILDITTDSRHDDWIEISRLYNFIQLSLNSDSAQVHILLTAYRRFAMVRISDNGPDWK